MCSHLLAERSRPLYPRYLSRLDLHLTTFAPNLDFNYHYCVPSLRAVSWYLCSEYLQCVADTGWWQQDPRDFTHVQTNVEWSCKLFLCPIKLLEIRFKNKIQIYTCAVMHTISLDTDTSHNKILWCLLRADQFSATWRTARNYTHILLSTRVTRNRNK